MLVMTDTIVEAGFGESIICYDDHETLADSMPEFRNLKWLNYVTDLKKVFYGEQNMPWPVWNRDLATYYCCAMDFQN